jgi:hypothetical protein
MRRDVTIPLLILGATGAAVLAYTKRGTIMLYGRKAIDAGKEIIFKLQLPSYAQPYGDIILQVSREESLDPFLIFGLGDRETKWGTTSYLDKPGPGGRGDAGHGHGLMQIDDRSFGSWLAMNNWADPYTNVKKGAQVLKAKLAFFITRSTIKGFAEGGRVYLNPTRAAARSVESAWYPDPRPLTGPLLWQAAIAAYNAGEGAVLMSIAAGKNPDVTTTGGDYFADVSRRATAVATKYDKATA